MRSLIQSIKKRLTRIFVVWPLFFLPKARKVRLERWVRGREQHQKLRQADCAIISFGKSGRTWLRVMMSRVYQVKYGLSERHLIGFDNLHYKNRAIPKIFFTHDNYLKDYTGNSDNKSDYYDRKVILLVRYPADVAVSQYFQWKFRMRPRKKELNEYPNHGADISMFTFVTEHEAGLKKVIDFMNLWARELDRIPERLIVRYEDMRADPQASLRDVMAFAETPASDEQISEAVRFASVDNMREMEAKRVFWLSGGRMQAKDRSDPNTYKVRRAKVGGFRDYFTAEETAEIEAMVSRQLSPIYGYGSEPAPVATVRAATA